MLDHPIPVDVPLLRKNEDHRMTVVGQIRIAMRSTRTDVTSISPIKCGDCTISSLGVLIRRLIVEKGNLEMVFVCGLLKESEIVVGKRSTLSVPIDDEP